jgi:AAA15 family ATPase/GTPase
MLNSLRILNFKGIKNVEISSLGQVNLIVGKNNSGKSSILEALMLYASGGSEGVLHKISKSYKEKSRVDSSPYEMMEERSKIPLTALPYEHIFYSRNFNKTKEISIGPIKKHHTYKKLVIQYIDKNNKTEEPSQHLDAFTLRYLNQYDMLNEEEYVLDQLSQYRHFLYIQQDDYNKLIPLEASVINSRRIFNQHSPYAINYIHVPARFFSMNDLAQLWDNITLTPYEKMTIDALKLIEPNIEDLRFVGDRQSNRTALIKLKDDDAIFPINSMGDGIIKILQLVLHMYASKDGFYLIDEFDNGLHYSVQKPLWDIIFRLSKELNVQVFATTHSWDCIQSFTEVSLEKKNIKGALLRIGKSKLLKNKGQNIITVFDEEKLLTINQTTVEVR